MDNFYIPKINMLEGGIAKSKLVTGENPFRMKPIDDTPPVPEFKDMMTGMLGELNKTVKAPDQTLQDVMTGNADIHDAMIAMSKAEVGINFATSIATKVVQAYEKVVSIQV